MPLDPLQELHRDATYSLAVAPEAIEVARHELTRVVVLTHPDTPRTEESNRELHELLKGLALKSVHLPPALTMTAWRAQQELARLANGGQPISIPFIWRSDPSVVSAVPSRPDVVSTDVTVARGSSEAVVLVESPAMTRQTPVLIIEPDEDWRSLIVGWLREKGFQTVYEATDPLNPVKTLSDHPDIGLVIMNVKREGTGKVALSNGLHEIATLRDQKPSVTIIVLTGYLLNRPSTLHETGVWFVGKGEAFRHLPALLDRLLGTIGPGTVGTSHGNPKIHQGFEPHFHGYHGRHGPEFRHMPHSALYGGGMAFALQGGPFGAGASSLMAENSVFAMMGE